MSIRIQDNSGISIKVNAWNWGVIWYTLDLGRMFDERMLANLRHGGASLSETEKNQLLDHLENFLLPMMSPGQRLLMDLSTTDKTDDGTFYRECLENNYSLQYDILVDIITFLKHATAPIEFL
jgi:hypothetical protein